VSVNGTLVEDKMRYFQDECAQFSFNKCPIYTHDGASAKFSTNSHEIVNSVLESCTVYILGQKNQWHLVRVRRALVQSL
jgi:hypothetical protein